MPRKDGCLRLCVRVCVSQPLSPRHFPFLPAVPDPACLILELILSNNHHQDNDTNNISNFIVTQNTQLGAFLSVCVLVSVSELSGVTFE